MIGNVDHARVPHGFRPPHAVGAWLAFVLALCAESVLALALEASPVPSLALEAREALAPIWLEWRLAEAGLGNFTRTDAGEWEDTDELRVAPGSSVLIGPRGIAPTQADALAALDQAALSVDGTPVALESYPALAGGKRYFSGDERDVAGSGEGYVAFAGVSAKNLAPGAHALVLRERFVAPSGPQTLIRHIRLMVAPYRSQEYLKRRETPSPLPRVGGKLRAPERSLVVIHARLFDGVADAPAADRALVIEGNRIRAIHPTAEIEIPESAEVLDASGATVLPGLIDAHMHTPARDHARWLTEGVTTLVEVSGDTFTMLSLRDRWLRDDEPHPRLLTAGSMILIPDGAIARRYGTHGKYEVASPVQASNAAGALARHGVNLIKIALTPDPRGRSLSDPQICDITAAAHRYGVPVMAHVMNEGAAVRAARCGVDILTHMPRLSDVAVANLRAAGVSVVPTLDVYDGDDYAHAASSVRRLLAAGVPIGCGSDYPGGSPREELRALVDAGLTPAQVLRAATRVNAEILGIDASLGTLEPGKIADVIVVEGDPLTDLTALDGLRAVVANGELVVATAGSPGF